MEPSSPLFHATTALVLRSCLCWMPTDCCSFPNCVLSLCWCLVQGRWCWSQTLIMRSRVGGNVRLVIEARAKYDFSCCRCPHSGERDGESCSALNSPATVSYGDCFASVREIACELVALCTQVHETESRVWLSWCMGLSMHRWLLQRRAVFRSQFSGGVTRARDVLQTSFRRHWWRRLQCRPSEFDGSFRF